MIMLFLKIDCYCTASLFSNLILPLSDFFFIGGPHKWKSLGAKSELNSRCVKTSKVQIHQSNFLCDLIRAHIILLKDYILLKPISCVGIHLATLYCQRGRATRKVSVCLSVYLFVKRLHCDNMEDRSVQIFIPYERSFSLVFRGEWLMVGVPFYLKFWVKLTPFERNR